MDKKESKDGEYHPERIVYLRSGKNRAFFALATENAPLSGSFGWQHERFVYVLYLYCFHVQVKKNQ